MIKCPNCGAKIHINVGKDIEATMWNFDGESADLEMSLCCEKCKNICRAVIHYKLTPTNNVKIYKR
jgi:hypothetical protein